MTQKLKTPLFERLKLGPNSVDVTPDKTGTILAVVGAEGLRPPTAAVRSATPAALPDATPNDTNKGGSLLQPPKKQSSQEASNLPAGQNSLLDMMRDYGMAMRAETYAYLSFGRDIGDLTAEELETIPEFLLEPWLNREGGQSD